MSTTRIEIVIDNEDARPGNLKPYTANAYQTGDSIACGFGETPGAALKAMADELDRVLREESEEADKALASMPPAPIRSWEVWN